MLTWAGTNDNEGRLWLSIAGLDSGRNVHVRWPEPEIRVGDEISLTVLETETVDDAKRSQFPEPSAARRWVTYLLPSVAIAGFAAVALYYSLRAPHASNLSRLAIVTAAAALVAARNWAYVRLFWSRLTRQRRRDRP
jgi:hypothetical protein